MGQRAYRYEPEDEAETPVLPPADPTAEMERLAADELSHALSHEWLELNGLVPWADTLPADDARAFEVVRSYRWADIENGDMVCEVTVHELPDRRGHLIRRTCVIRRN